MHKFIVGQSVHFTGEAGTHHASGAYQIVRLLPTDTAGEFQYRLRKSPEGQERVVREHQLIHAPAEETI